jgi:hypothetical protein
MGKFSFQKTLTPHNICRGFKITRICLLDINVITCKMQPSEQFVEINIDFHIVDLQVEELLGECPFTTEPNACH